jgi:hypothetical protein
MDILLGPDSRPILNKTQGGLRSTAKLQERRERKIPRVLSTIASPRDDFTNHLKVSESNVAVFKWDVVRECLGDVADIAKLPMSSVGPEV